jgi:transcriptional regulator
MYIPSAFEQKDRDRLFELIEAHNFGLLVSLHEGRPLATHLPFLLERDRQPVCLAGHVARANPQWHGLEGQEALAIFSGPHAYISPTWYEADQVVPTWNYVAVHVYGTVRLIEDVAELTQLVEALVRHHEQPMPAPWRLDVTSSYFHKQIRAIVGFRMEITRLEGKWKLNQNHSVERRERVIKALAASSDQVDQEVSRLMEETLE